MIARIVFVSLLIIQGIFCEGQKGQLNRSDFYSAMESNSMELLDNQEEAAKSADNSGFEGALLMKKAALVSKTTEKLSLFKSGHRMLDAAIKNDEGNAELRFLRLMVQEHAPGILNYRGDIDDDSNIIKKSFDQLHPEARKAIIRYSKTSKVLKPTDFDGS